jgi:hypothetical protein
MGGSRGGGRNALAAFAFGAMRVSRVDVKRIVAVATRR